MAKRRRRATHSFWLDALRQNSSAKSLRRSARESQRTNQITTQTNSHINTQNENAPNPSSNQADPVLDPDLDLSEDLPPATPSQSGQASPLLLTALNHATPTIQQLTTYGNEQPSNASRHNHYSESGASVSPGLEEAMEPDELDEQKDDDEGSEHQTVFQPFEMDDGEGRQDPVPHTDSALNDEYASSPAHLAAAPPTCLGRFQYQPGESIPGNDVTIDEQALTDSVDADSLEDLLHQNLQIWKANLNLAAIVAVVGSVRFTVQQYDYTRDVLRDAGADPTWLPFARTQKYFNRIIETCLPHSEMLKLAKKKVITPTLCEEEGSSDSEDDSSDLETSVGGPPSLGAATETENVRVFLPSAWAKIDVATSVVFDQMFPSYNDEQHTESALEGSRIIRDRESITSSCNHIFIAFEGQQVRCLPGSHVEVSVQSQSPSFESVFSTHSFQDSYVIHAIRNNCRDMECCNSA